MQRRISYLLGLLIILLFGSSIVLRADSNVCPVGSTQDQTVLDLPQKEAVTPGGAFSVPRNQVLLEIITRTT